MEKEVWDSDLAEGKISPEEHKAKLEQSEWQLRRSDYVECLSNSGVIGKLWYAVAAIAGFLITAQLLSAASWSPFIRVPVFLVLWYIAMIFLLLPLTQWEVWRYRTINKFSDARVLEAYKNYKENRTRRGILVSIIAVLCVLALAATVPSKTNHEQELRPTVREWARTLKVDTLGEAIAGALLNLGTDAITDDPKSSVIDICNWKYENFFFLSVVWDTDDAHQERLVSWGLLNHVYVNQRKFKH